MKCDWSVVGKAEHHCVVIFFFSPPAVQTVHMFQVNKPGVDVGAAVFKAVLCHSFYSFIHYQNRTACGNQVCLTDDTVEHVCYLLLDLKDTL